MKVPAVSHGRVLFDTHNDLRLAVDALSGGGLLLTIYAGCWESVRAGSQEMMQEVWSFRVGRPCKQRHNRSDHDKARRTVGERIGLDTTSVFKWEANTVSPDIRCMPAIIRFLGYNPLPEAKSWGERLIRHRTSLGMTRGEAAKRIDVDPGTLARWERGEKEPAGMLLERLERFLDEAEAELDARRVG